MPGAPDLPDRTPPRRPGGFQRLAITTTVLTLVVVAVGGAVRATDSGLACPDWPRCFGMWIPPAGFHVWLEHSHRLLAGLVGILIAVQLVWALVRYRRRPDVLWPAISAAVFVNAQAALGALVVLQLLRAELVTAHLGMAMVVVASLLTLSVNVALPRVRPAGRDLRLARTALVVAGITYVQILVGGHVTGIGAGLAYTDFPLMGGTLLPAVGSPQEAYHVAHRALALAVAVGVVALAVRAQRAGARGWLLHLPRLAVVLVAVQVVLGVANLVNRLSALTVIPHLTVAGLLWAVLVLSTLLAYRLAPAATAAPTRGEQPAQAPVGAR